jgi:AraC-like DNA-binding protein
MSLSSRKTHFLARNFDVSPLGGVRMSGFVKDGRGVLQKRRVLNRYCLVYVIKGEGTYVDTFGREFKIKEHDAFITMPEIPHHYGPTKTGFWDEIYIIFEGPVFDLWRGEGLFNWPEPTVNLPTEGFWIDRFVETVNGDNGGDPRKMMAEALRLQTLLSDISALGNASIESDLEWLGRAKEGLNTYKTNEEAAQYLDMSYESFRKKFRKLSGKSPGRYRTGKVMESACELLETTDLTVKALAEKLDYCDEYHFSKQFSKTIGLSPSSYRALSMMR